MTAFVFLLDEIRWQIFRRIHEEDKKLDPHLRAAQKITASIIIYHPLSTMEVVSRVLFMQALIIFDPTTSGAMERYFPDNVTAARFLSLFSQPMDRYLIETR